MATIKNIIITTVVSGGMILGGILYIVCGMNYKVPITMIFTLGVSLAIYLIIYLFFLFSQHLLMRSGFLRQALQ